VHFHLVYRIHGSVIGLVMTHVATLIDNTIVVFCLNLLLEYLVKTHRDGSNKIMY